MQIFARHRYSKLERRIEWAYLDSFLYLLYMAGQSFTVEVVEIQRAAPSKIPDRQLLCLHVCSVFCK